MKELKITIVNDTAIEKETAARLRSLLDKYDVSKYMFTNSVRIEHKVIPHSHPVLTLNSFPYTDENIILEMFIHEQLHWYLESTSKNVSGAVNELRERYPNAPWGFPLGCKDLDSTYNHLILCFLSHNAMVEIVGDGAAKQVLYYLQNHHYLWVYETIEADADHLAALIAKYDLALTSN